MRKSARIVSIAVSGILLVSAAGVALFAMNASRAQTPSSPAPCACSRSTPILGADDVTVVPGTAAPRYGVIHCQCGIATCVSQITYGSVGVPQLFCVK